MNRPLRIALVGATGAVGQELISILAERRFPVERLDLYASENSVGKVIDFNGQAIAVRALSHDVQPVDIAFFSAGASRSRDFAADFVRDGAFVIDNSSAFRMDGDVPLVVPEINGAKITSETKVVSVPNCTAILLLMAVAPLRSLGKIDRLIVSTYQSASGAGASAMQELVEQTRTVLSGGQAEPKVFPHPYAFNLFSHNTPIDEDGYNEEEAKVIQECRKILGDDELRINVTCVRVPVLRAHSESVTIEFADAAPDLHDVRNVLHSAPGVRLVDDRGSNTFPMPLSASGGDDVLVGRIRQDHSNPNAICLFLSGDQLRKGAALNAVQIAERLIAEHLVN